MIEFKSGEDCSRLANVRLNLFTANGDVYTESAERMEGTNKYTVVTSGVIPVNVGVEYLCCQRKIQLLRKVSLSMIGQKGRSPREFPVLWRFNE